MPCPKCNAKKTAKKCEMCDLVMCGACMKTHADDHVDRFEPVVEEEVVAEVVPEVADEYAEYAGGAMLAEDGEDDDEDNGEDDDAVPEVSAGAGRAVVSVVSKNANDAKKGIKVAAKGVRMTWDIATDIRRRTAEGDGIDEIAEAIGFHPCAVRRVVRGETWTIKKTEGTTDDGFVRDNIRLVAHVPTAEEIAEMKRRKAAPKAKKEKAEGSGEKRTREAYKARIAELEEQVKKLEAMNAYLQKTAEAANQRAEMAENARRAIIEAREDAEVNALYEGV
jgi:hypothetical protein